MAIEVTRTIMTAMGPSPELRWTTVCIDCANAERLADFYCHLLGWKITARDGDGWVQAR